MKFIVDATATPGLLILATVYALTCGMAVRADSAGLSGDKPRGFPEPTFIKANGIRLAVYERGDGFPVVLCHGFPELAYSWRHQLPALADAGFHAIALDQRGYGASDRPDAVDA